MKCEQCGCRTRVVFGRLICNHCETMTPPLESAGVGYVVVDLKYLRGQCKRPVFRTWAMADRWMSIRGIANGEVHAVGLPSYVEWRRPGGKLLGIELADQSFYVEVNLAGARTKRCQK